jgi:HEAT repeat protein
MTMNDKDSYIQNLISDFESEDLSKRREAVDALVQVGEEAVLPLLYSVRPDYDGVSDEVLEVLKRIGDSVMPILIKALFDQNDFICWKAASILLEELEDIRTLEPLTIFLENLPKRGFNVFFLKSNIIRSAVGALAKLGKPALPAMLHIFKITPINEVKAETAKGLGSIGDRSAFNQLIEAINDKDERVRQGVIIALGKIGEPKAFNLVLAALSDSSLNVRLAAVGALGELGDSQGVKPLLQSVKDTDNIVREEAISSLLKLDKRLALNVLLEALHDPHANVRRLAVQELGFLGDKKAVEPLINALKDEFSGVRFYAMAALGRLGDKRAIEPIKHLLETDEDKLVKETAAKIIYQDLQGFL